MTTRRKETAWWRRGCEMVVRGGAQRASERIRADFGSWNTWHFSHRCPPPSPLAGNPRKEQNYLRLKKLYLSPGDCDKRAFNTVRAGAPITDRPFRHPEHRLVFSYGGVSHPASFDLAEGTPLSTNSVFRDNSTTSQTFPPGVLRCFGIIGVRRVPSLAMLVYLFEPSNMTPPKPTVMFPTRGVRVS
jgi:hypothetical protein